MKRSDWRETFRGGGCGLKGKLAEYFYFLYIQPICASSERHRDSKRGGNFKEHYSPVLLRGSDEKKRAETSA